MCHNSGKHTTNGNGIDSRAFLTQNKQKHLNCGKIRYESLF